MLFFFFFSFFSFSLCSLSAAKAKASALRAARALRRPLSAQEQAAVEEFMSYKSQLLFSKEVRYGTTSCAALRCAPRGRCSALRSAFVRNATPRNATNKPD